MRGVLRVALLGAWLCGYAGRAGAAGTLDPQHPPAEAFGALPAISSPALSPDGLHLAIIRSVLGRPAVLIYELPLDAGKKPAVVGIDQWLVDGIFWAKNDRLILRIKDNRTAVDGALTTWERAVAVGVDGKNPKGLMENVEQSGVNPEASIVTDLAPEDPDHIYMPLWTGDASEYDNTIQRVDVHTGLAKQLARANEDTERWLMDGHGRIVARIDFKHIALTDELYIYHGLNNEHVASFPASGDKNSGLEGLSDDGNALVMDRLDDKDRHVMRRRGLTTGAETLLFAAPGYDVEGPIQDDWTGRVVGASYADDKMEYRYFDPSREALQRGLEAAFPDASVVAVSSDLLGDKVIAGVDRAYAPPEYYLVDRATSAVTSLGRTYPGLRGVVLGEMKPYPYTARDGLAIPAYLTLPPGKPPKNLPLVVMPHGGPDARDTISFDWWAQFLVNRGYAVLQPNYRGSSGYGRKFTEAGFRQWGLKMQDDISDGVKKVIADGIADPKRVCIVGASYGGYAALAGGAFTPDLYACVVSFAGISDLPHMLHTEHEYNGKQTEDFWTTRIGSTDENSDQLKATSPGLHAANFRAPVLLMHGEGDTTVHIDQSEEMERALREAGKNVTFIRFAGEDHYLNLTDTRVRILEETEKFLDDNIGH